jgi:hypothetical protein
MGHLRRQQYNVKPAQDLTKKQIDPGSSHE